MVKIALELSILEPIQQDVFFVPNLGQKMYVPDKILGCLYIATQEFTWKKKWIFKQSAAPTLANARLRRHRPKAGGGAWACWEKWSRFFFLNSTNPFRVAAA